MLHIDPKQKKKIVTRRILLEVARYYETQGLGMQMNILSAKYGTALSSCGGFPEVIEEMRTLGQIQVQITKSGARFVLPSDGKLPLEDKASDWF